MNCKFKNFFSNIDIEEIALRTGFKMREEKKISPLNYLLSFIKVNTKNHFSLRAWAGELGSLIPTSVTHQALDKKMQNRHLLYVEEVFAECMKKCMIDSDQTIQGYLASFNRVLIEDSTCIKMANALYSHLSGVSNGLVKRAICRIQFCINLKNQEYENLELTTYTKNDGAYASSIIDRIEPNDLVIRDLGYWKIEVFRSIAQVGAYFLSKFKLGIKTYDLQGIEYDLVSQLKRNDRRNIAEFDKKLRIGLKEKMEVRMVGYKLTQAQAQQKRRAAIKSRHKDIKISTEANYMMSWNIYITNVEEEVWSIKSIYSVYRLRWHIEMIFKNWKSNFKIDTLLQSCKTANIIRPKILLNLSLIFIVVVYQPAFNLYQKRIYQATGKFLSPLKFGQFVVDKFDMLCRETDSYLIQYLSRYYCYDTRHDRRNSWQILQEDFALG